ncbi:hypothetical protein LJC26_04465 [Desulfovibrio sp. OttesenSCG-928-O18]|nr:hypothetical protein [Desulfovibrio sp. OttesenSCG-928-O18]
MRDDLGFYYYPNPADTRGRVYVRQGENGIEFRLWHAEYPMVWEKHEWVPQAALEAAAAMYRNGGKGSDPMALYDVAVAKALLKEAERSR